MIDCFRKMVKHEKPNALFRGVLFNMVYGTGGAFLLVAWDKMKYMGGQD